MDVRLANLIPGHASTPAQARGLIARDGAALVSDIPSVDAAVTFAKDVLGDHAVRVRPQIEATKASMDRDAPIVAAQPADERGRKRYLGSPDSDQPAHNDGFGFGDFAPDHIFLYCERPCSLGGASFLVDALTLLTIVGADDPALAEFSWSQPIDQTEPNFPLTNHAAIARRTPSGRVQVRSHPYFAPIAGPHEQEHEPFVTRWRDAVAEARDTGPHFRLRAGQLICIDNYRMLHGRNSYTDPDRKIVSIWGWTTAAVAVPDGELDIVAPTVPVPAALPTT